MVENFHRDIVVRTKAQRRAKLVTWRALRHMGLPVPHDLEEDVKAMGRRGPRNLPKPSERKRRRRERRDSRRRNRGAYSGQ